MAKTLVLVVGARLAELHEAARYAGSHGNGLVTLTAAELQELLPALPEEYRTPTHLELTAKDMQEKEAARKAAEPASAVTAEDLEKPVEIDFGTGKNAKVAETIEETADGTKITPGPAADKLTPALQPAGPVAVAEAGGDPAKTEPEPTAAQLGAAVRQIPGNEPLVNVPAETVTASSEPKPAA